MSICEKLLRGITYTPFYYEVKCLELNKKHGSKIKSELLFYCL